MTPLVFVDNRPGLPREAVATIKLGAVRNDTWLIKPSDARCDARIGPNVNIVDPRDLRIDKPLRAFRDRYVHLSTNSVRYERGCFERFIMLHGLMRVSGLTQAWHFDTDAWAATNLSLVASGLSDCDVVAHIQGSLDERQPSVSVSQAWISVSVLSQFVDFIITDLYSSRLIRQLEDWYSHRVSSGLTGGVSDMAAWGLFLSQRRDLRVLNSYSSLVDGFLLVDTLYTAITRQLQAVGMEPSSGRVAIRSGSHPPTMDVNGFLTPIAGVHFSGADKALIFDAIRRSDIRVESTRHKLGRLEYRLRRRLLSFGRSEDS